MESTDLGTPVFACSIYRWAQAGATGFEAAVELKQAYDTFKEMNPDGRLLVMGDLNWDPTQLKRSRDQPGVELLWRMFTTQTGPTCKTRTSAGQIERQVDYILADFPIEDLQIVLQPHHPRYGSDHACMACTLDKETARESTAVPSRKFRDRFIKEIDSGSSIFEAIAKVALTTERTETMRG